MKKKNRVSGQLAVGSRVCDTICDTRSVGDDPPTPPSPRLKVHEFHEHVRTMYIIQKKRKEKKTEDVTMTTIVLTTTLIICGD